MGTDGASGAAAPSWVEELAAATGSPPAAGPGPVPDVGGALAGLQAEVHALRDEVRGRESQVLSAAALVELQAEVAGTRDVLAAVASRVTDPRPELARLEARIAALTERLDDVAKAVLAVEWLAEDVEALRKALLGD